MKDSFVCLFKVKFYDDVNGGIKEECGMTFADSFSGAADYLERVLYGENLLTITHMELLDTTSTFSENLWNQMREELNAE